jgi:membrane protease YdiL (CAAX protease family)
MGAIAAIFVNKSEKRLRAGWRILIHLIALIAFGLIAGFAASQIPNRAIGESVYAVLYLVATVGATWLIARYIDRRRFAAYGFNFSTGWWVDLMFGLVLGAVLMSGIVFAMIHAGWATLREVSVTNLQLPIVAAFAIQVLGLIVVGINEELVFRGYHLRNISEGFSRFGTNAAIIIALIISSSFFGVVHLANEAGGGAHTTPLALLNLILAGLMLAVPFLLTGELAIPIGIHITWNLFQGPVFGLAVSGMDSETRLVTVNPIGPELWTGGAYGAEGGLLATIAVGASLVISAIWIAVRKKELRLQASVATYTPR